MNKRTLRGFSDLRVSTRLQLLVGLTLLGLLTLCVTALIQLKGNMLEDRKQKTMNLVEVGVGVLDHFHQLAAEGKLTEDEARSAAKETLRGLRYNTSDYFFILDDNNAFVLHPAKPEYEGQPKGDLQDANGKLFVPALVAAGKSGGGFVDYWFPKPGQQKPEPKLSYAKAFAPWGWTLSTGIYIDDVDAEYLRNAVLFGGISLALLGVLSFLGWKIGSSVLRQLGGEPAQAAAIMHRVAEGDLTASTGNPPMGSLLHALGTMVSSLRGLVREIEAGANDVVSNAEHISHASSEVATAAEHQADATSSMAAAIEELTVSSSHISDSAGDAEQNSREAMRLSSDGSHRVESATAAIQKIADTVTDASRRIHALETRANQVSSIASVIKEIAGQTNLLALNAAIEAARAGEQGRGFAVVADEVRKLAERTSSATLEIEEMILGIQGDTVSAVEAMSSALPEVEGGVELARSATESLRTIEVGAGHTLERIGEVANATREQSAASTSIAQKVESIAQMVEQTTATIRGTAETATQLEQIARGLKTQIEHFKV